MSEPTLLTKDNLILAGYLQYEDALHRDYSIGYLQKDVIDENGIRYFINIRMWNFSKIGGPELSLEPTVQFYGSDGIVSFNATTFNSSATTVGDMHDFFDKLWRMMDCGYYEKKSY